MPTIGRRLILCVIITLLARSAAAQDTGIVTGTVVDASGQVLPGATVTLTNEATQTSRTLATNERGEFTFRAVQPGTYTVAVELSGFRKFEQRNNVLNASSQLAVGTVKLEIGALAESVTVTAQGTVVETKNSDYAGLLTSTQIAQIQTKGRDVVNLLRLLPGVHYENDIDAMGDSFGSQIPNIGGQRRAWNQVTVDGLNGNELSGTGRMNSSINLDAIAEVKVLLNTYKAEFGHTGGANIEIVSKSGSAQYHGSGYWYGRRDAWNATPWENNRAGLAKPLYHIDTPGANIGGPLRVPGLFGNDGNNKLFFFYSFEAPQVQKPGQVRLYRMPTALERQGDFSQTFDVNGRLMFIKDPASPLACNVTSGGPGCFPGNVIPKTRLDPNGLAILNALPLPNAGSGAISNFQRQETADNPRFNQLLRIDGHPSGNNSYWGSFRTFQSNQYGSEITAGPAKWGWFNGSYKSGDSGVNGGWNHVASNKVNELAAGFRRANEGFGTKDAADLARLQKSTLGITLGQFHPELNPQGYVPVVQFGLNTTGVDTPDFTYDNRLGQTAYDYLGSIRDNFTWTRDTHTFKTGGIFEYMQNNEARGGNWSGQIQFNNNSSNPLNTNFAYSNALLGVYSQYTESDRYRITMNRQWWSEWYAQDTWQRSPRMTVDYGARFLWYSPYWRPDGQVANFDPAAYDPKKAVRLYQPATINGARVAYDPVTGQSLNPIFIGAYVPGSGNESNGLVNEDDPGVPKGFRKVLAPAIEPRLGLTWDLQGTGKMVLHSSAGYFHQARLGGGSLGNLAGNPPFIHNPILYYGTLNNLLAPGAAQANRPATLEALEPNYKTPSSLNWTAGLRREIGWGTAIDATYSGYKSYHMEMYYDLNPVPDGARFLDLNPQNRDPTGNATAVLPPEFLRPYRGYQNIRVRGNSATGDYHALQLQVNRRYIRGLQFGAAYTLQRARGFWDEDPGNPVYSFNRPSDFFYSELTQSNRHSLVVNYAWELPGRHDGMLKLALEGWQLSGENDFYSGDWGNVVVTTTDNFDFTGGEAGNGQCLAGSETSASPCLHLVRPVLVGDPLSGGGDALTGLFNTAAFARPARGDYGNAPRNVVRRPGFTNTNLAVFKNFGLGGSSRSAQFRAEFYNLFNQVEFQDVDRTARFDATGKQVSTTFGTAYGIGGPTRPPRIVQLSLRLNF